MALCSYFAEPALKQGQIYSVTKGVKARLFTKEGESILMSHSTIFSAESSM